LIDIEVVKKFWDDFIENPPLLVTSLLYALSCRDEFINKLGLRGEFKSNFENREVEEGWSEYTIRIEALLKNRYGDNK